MTSAIFSMAERLRPVLLRLARRLRHESRDVLSPLDLVLLAHVAKRPGILASELADLEQMSRPSMSAHAKRLAAQGWVRRQAPDDLDRRRVGLVLSVEGQDVLTAARRKRTDWLALRLSRLPPQQALALEGALEALAALADEGL
jgi:DNA-binding MarR family transcriptional regulator